MSVVEAKPKVDTAPVGTLIPSAVRIAAVRAGAEAYRGSPAFMRDSLDMLDDKQREATRPDHVVALIESESLSAYGHFCWTVDLAEDYKADFGLSARGAYALHKEPQATFTDLKVSGVGEPFTSIVAEVPKSYEGDRVVFVVAIYARSSEKKVLHEVGRMFRTEVNCR